MSELAAAQIPKPTDEQAFERANEVLWQRLLNDPSASLYGRRGQEQVGVDIVGKADGDPSRIVGIQCKLKSEHKKLTEQEVRAEVEKAKRFRPSLHRYVIVTTAPDDANLTTLALELSQEISRGQKPSFGVEIMGWQALERAIRRFPEALKAFDPSNTPHGDRLLAYGEEHQRTLIEKVVPTLDKILQNVTTVAIGSANASGEPPSRLNSEIDRYAKLIATNPSTAFYLFEELEAGLEKNASGRVRFRVRANLAACQLEMSNVEQAIAGF